MQTARVICTNAFLHAKNGMTRRPRTLLSRSIDTDAHAPAPAAAAGPEDKLDSHST